ncbi:GFA family protein [Pelagibius marinus]|uniref:GFA family protein n=1 Tax=Pelagibius marinus TaxID=2762760 RepID=UPI0018730366|nr:GFA family protein [Pelagibius marinus]
MTETPAKPLTGGCLCGAVHYEITAEPILTGHCYCEDCRRTSGTAHGTHVMVPEESFAMTGALSAYDRPADSGNMVSRRFCPTCGSAVFSTNSGMPGFSFVRASSLDDLDAVTPSAVVYASRAPRWDPVDPSLPSFAEMPTEAERQAMTSQEG